VKQYQIFWHNLHTANTTALLQDFFDERAVGLGLWPQRSLDLITRGFFLWGFLKEIFDWKNSLSIEELKHNIEQEVANVDPETLRKVSRNIKRVETCLREGGRHF
jgi:hypothetical protein